MRGKDPRAVDRALLGQLMPGFSFVGILDDEDRSAVLLLMLEQICCMRTMGFRQQLTLLAYESGMGLATLRSNEACVQGTERSQYSGILLPSRIDSSRRERRRKCQAQKCQAQKCHSHSVHRAAQAGFSCRTSTLLDIVHLESIPYVR